MLFSQTVTSFVYGFVTNLAQMRRDTVPNKFTPVYSLLLIFFIEARSVLCTLLYFFLETRWLCDKRETIRSLALVVAGFLADLKVLEHQNVILKVPNVHFNCKIIAKGV